jgi:hypothetical protein
MKTLYSVLASGKENVAVGVADIEELSITATLSIQICGELLPCMHTVLRKATVLAAHTLTLSCDAAACGTTERVSNPSSLGCMNPCHLMLAWFSSGLTALPLAALKSSPNTALDRTEDVNANAVESRS